MLVETAILQPGLRAVCIREIQKSLAQSVKALIELKIISLGVGHLFEVLDKEIRTPGGGVIIFQGMQNHTAESIKSLEGYDIAWVEEAQSLSAHSLKLLRPTIRKPGSQLWFSWNPASPDDPVDALLRGERKIEAASVVEANWTDNPWFPEELVEEMRIDRLRDDDEFDHIWNGSYLTITEAIIFRRRVVYDVFDPPESARFLYGADWGFAVDPTALIRCWIDGDSLFIDHEAYGDQVELDDLPALFIGGHSNDGKDTFKGVPGCKRWPIKADGSRPETISKMHKAGFNISAAKKWPGSVEDGIAHLKGFRRIVIHERCKRLASEARLYSYKVDKQTGDILPIIVDKFNHGWDAVRYALDGYIQGRGVISISDKNRAWAKQVRR